MGERVIGVQAALAVVDAWLECEFEGGGSTAKVAEIAGVGASAPSDAQAPQRPVRGGRRDARRRPARARGRRRLTGERARPLPCSRGRRGAASRSSPEAAPATSPPSSARSARAWRTASPSATSSPRPRAKSVAEVVRALAPPDGALFVYGNYEGDVMNFGLAAELLADDGIPTETVLVTDDVASAPAGQEAERRGVAGGMVVVKAASARGGRGRRASPRSPRPRASRTRARARSASASGRARCRRRARRTSSSQTTRWTSGWASTARRASVALRRASADETAAARPRPAARRPRSCRRSGAGAREHARRDDADGGLRRPAPRRRSCSTSAASRSSARSWASTSPPWRWRACRSR